jgi:glycosyltransferase involved in cell wall biosynthesis
MHPLLMPARGARQFVTVYDLYFLDDPAAARAEIRRDYVPLAATHARRAAGVVVISAYTARQVHERLGVPRDRIVYCPPGAPAWQARTGQPGSGPLLFIGSAAPRKNLPRLLGAYARLLNQVPAVPDLVLAGDPPAPGSDLAAMLARAPWSGRVRTLGYVEDGRREALYKEAALLLLPSLDEGFGMTAVEAMSAGVPVVASDRGALPEVTAGAALLVDPEDESALAGAMARVLTEPGLAAAMAARGRARADDYTWEGSAARLLAAYRAACAGQPPGNPD